MSDEQSTQVAEPTKADEFASQYALRDIETATTDETPGDEKIPPEDKGDDSNQQTKDTDDSSRADGGKKESSAETVTKTDAGDGFDDAVLKLAAEYKLSPEEAKRFGTPDALKASLTLLDRRYVEMGSKVLADQARGAQGTKTPGQTQSTPQQTEQAKTPAQPQQAAPVVTDDLKLNLDGWDPDVQKAFKDLHTHHTQQIHALRAEADQAIRFVNEQVQLVHQHAQLSMFDRVIGGLGKEYADVLGEGDSLDLDPDSAVGKKRSEIWQQAQALSAGYRADGIQLPWNKVVRRAAHMVLADKTNELARKKVRQEEAEANERTTARPSHRQGREQAGGEQAAIERWEKFADEHGL